MNLPTPKQRHKHYQCIMALANGWRVECLQVDGKWLKIIWPNFSVDCEYRIVPDENGWLPWYATEDSVCPVDGNVTVDYRTTNSLHITMHLEARELNWSAGTTLNHYRPHQERKLVKTVKHYDDGSMEVA
jgi:hypothetical protein